MPRPTRILVVMPSWVGDTVMATPALRALRRALPGAFIGGLLRPGLEALLTGTDLLDESHVDRAVGMMGPKRVAAKVRMRRYDAALLLTNSFSTALIARLAGIERRVGYDRDGRGLLLTDRLRAPLRRDTPPYDRSRTAPGEWAPVPACAYYFALVSHFLKSVGTEAGVQNGAMGPMEAAVTADEAAAADSFLRSMHFSPQRTPREEVGGGGVRAGAGGEKSVRAGEGIGATEPTSHSVPPSVPSVSSVVKDFAILNPGGNNPAKRWPADRFAALASWLVRERGMAVLVSGAPSEADLTATIVAQVDEAQRANVIDLPAALSAHAGSPPQPPNPNPQTRSTPPTGLALLKAIIARASLMVTNDTGPRHIAAALGVPVVSLFGPTDHRWTTIPFERERIIVADPTLPEEEVANDHPQRCAIERIDVERVIRAAESVLLS